MATTNRKRIDSEVLERVNVALDDIRAGKMVILVDDEDRENEGDLVVAAQHITADAINFMATHGRGLICLALDEAQITKLDLPMMEVRGRGGPPLGTAFTMSIEAARGVTTGISAADRAHTIKVACAADATPQDLLTPGHIFPLKARRGGVLVRTGQTEGSVDLARLAGLSAAGVICEIMKDDGTMARMPDLEVFAEQHELLILTVADLIEYRLQTETLVQRACEHDIVLDQTGTQWHVIIFDVLVEERQALMLVKGVINPEEPTLCRVHGGSVVADLFASTPSEGGANLREAIDQIEAHGSGVLLYLVPQLRLADEATKVAAHFGGVVPPAADSVPGIDEATASRSDLAAQQILRKFGLGAQMLADVGVSKLRLLTNSQRKIAGLTGYGLEIVERVPLRPKRATAAD